MKFSEVFRLVRSPDDDWFGPILNADTKLFVDPFRIYGDEQRSWTTAHNHLITFFNIALKLLARSGFDKRSNHWRAATRLLVFPEPSEFCLGYSKGSPLGSGSGPGLQQGMLDGAVEGIRLGIESSNISRN